MRESELRPYERRTLASRIDDLINQQKANWQLLRDNIRNCSLAETKTIPLGDFAIVGQCNPDRMWSATAKVDQASTQERPCKLCVENLFEEQEGVAYDDELVILCNPYPILDRHLSIVDRTHVRQAIGGRLPSILGLAKDLSREYAVLYNGPQCGASMPEHFHVQACARQCLPVIRHLDMIENDLALRMYKQDVVREEGIEVFALMNYHVSLLVYRGADRAALTAWADQTLRRFAALTGTSDEPLINLLVMFDDPGWTVYLFPRETHRPICYFEGTLTVSPASLDMAGWLVVPVRKQFQEISAKRIKDVFAEVTLQPHAFSQLVQTITP